MAQIIDALVVSLGLDASNFTKGQKEAVNSLRNTEAQATRTAKEMQTRGAQAGEFFGKIRNQVLALTAAVVGAKSVTQFAEQITQSDAAAGRLANNLGMTTQQLTAWEGAARRAGGTTEGMAGSLQNITTQLQELYTTGNAPFLVPLARAGVNMGQFLNQATPMTERMLELADAFQKMSPERAQYLGAGIGLDQGTINLLMMGRDAVQAQIDAQKKMGTVSKEDAEAAKARQKAWNDLSDTITGVGRSIMTDLTPAIVGVEKGMKDWVQDNKDWIETDIGSAIKSFIKVEDDAAKATDGWSVAAQALLAIWTGAKFAAAFANAKGLSGLTVGIGRVMGELFGLGIGATNSVALLAQHGDTPDNAPNDYKPSFLSQGGPFENFIRRSLGMSPAYNKQLESNYTSRLMQMGWSKEQASGIVANIMAESGGSASATGDNGKAFGLAQWHPDRQAAFAKLFGHDIQHSTADEQLQFINWELRNSESRAGNMLSRSTNAGQAGSIVSSMYERPADALGQSQARAGIARDVYSLDPGLYAGTQPRPVLSPGNTSTATTTVNVGGVTVNTKATDAKGIAQGIGGALNNELSAQNNGGMQ
jgi:hypothetical protein